MSRKTMNNFVYLHSNTTQKDYDIWKDYGVADDLSIIPYVDTWNWNSLILKDMYVNEHYKLIGAIFSLIDDKYTLLCYNDGRNLIKVQDDRHYYDFNSQLENFNYLRAKARSNF